jgi:hypothetical protein
MIVTTDDATFFFSLYRQLDAFALNRSGLFSRHVTPDDLQELDITEAARGPHR